MQLRWLRALPRECSARKANTCSPASTQGCYGSAGTLSAHLEARLRDAPWGACWDLGLDGLGSGGLVETRGGLSPPTWASCRG
jgi:hypothetical protein